MKRPLTIQFILLFFIISNIKNAQVGIGTHTPDESTVLDISSNNKGISLPNINLTAKNDSTTISNPKKGLLIFKPSNDSISDGFYYNSGNSTDPNWLHLHGLSSSERKTIVKLPLDKVNKNNVLILNDIEIRYNPDTKTSQIKSVTGDELIYNVFIMENWKWDEGGSGTFRNAYSGNNNCKITGTFTNICRGTMVNTTRGTKSEANDFWIYIGDDTYHYYFSLVNGNYASLILEKF
ncbi:hypothetical protein UJ101_01253 [Flavobacteriaceae bacterium UJ101]|nr:hypothetical protein UJ101_01253 [Flavobacteriaceae bacterium UJ101]